MIDAPRCGHCGRRAARELILLGWTQYLCDRHTELYLGCARKIKGAPPLGEVWALDSEGARTKLISQVIEVSR